MKIPQAFQSVINTFSREKNSRDPDNLGNRFLKYGNNKAIVQDWSRVVMSDRDLYVGYSYAAISTRANKTSQLAINNLKTDASPELEEAAKSKEEEITHPYLEIINKSKTFSNYNFWYNISTFLDLEGVYYLMVVRNKQGNRTGNIQEFKLLNPYNIKRVRDQDTGEVGGYIESKNGLVREIPKHMIIDIRNKFKEIEFNTTPNLVYTIYCNSTIEAKSIAATKETPIYKVINETEKEILYDEESGDIIL